MTPGPNEYFVADPMYITEFKYGMHHVFMPELGPFKRLTTVDSVEFS